MKLRYAIAAGVLIVVLFLALTPQTAIGIVYGDQLPGNEPVWTIVACIIIGLITLPALNVLLANLGVFVFRKIKKYKHLGCILVVLVFLALTPDNASGFIESDGYSDKEIGWSMLIVFMMYLVILVPLYLKGTGKLNGNQSNRK